ncbi:Abi family protein [Rheinheimera sp. D18]|uniref:Abi family protein n=1 Tax=Rheinheimera sp. D18 TaxID=2545632 RepID=UPI001FB6321D|nr:Abi family protein [Rheinheimera sp. D18]
MAYDRPWLSYQEQLEQLKLRGMVITDDVAALDYLQRIGYYRLSAYWYPFRHFRPEQNPETGVIEVKAQNKFIDNSEFIDAVNLYLFDKQLRLLLIDALERIEVSLRVEIAYLLGKRNAFAHINVNQFHPSFVRKPIKGTNKTAWEFWLEKYQGLVSRSKEDFVRHYLANHGPNIPIWVAVEVFDFGAISQLISMMKIKDQQTIAEKYCVSGWQVFKSWIFGLSYLRNLVAHHSRLWNRNITTKPSIPKSEEATWYASFRGNEDLLSKPFLLIAITRQLMLCICPNTQWHIRLQQHLLSFPKQHSDKKLNLNSVGVDEKWQDWWSTK